MVPTAFRRSPISWEASFKVFRNSALQFGRFRPRGKSRYKSTRCSLVSSVSRSCLKESRTSTRIKKIEPPPAPWLHDTELHQILQFLGGHAQNCARLLQFGRSEEHTSELQSRFDIVCRLLLEK